MDEIVAVLVTRDIDERDTGTVLTTLTHPIEIASKEITTTDFKAFLHNLRGELVGTVLGGEAYDMVNGPAAIWRGTVLADMLDAPVSELSMCHNVDVSKDLFDARSLLCVRFVTWIVKETAYLVFL